MRGEEGEGEVACGDCWPNVDGAKGLLDLYRS